jgi:hypothetical protein
MKDGMMIKNNDNKKTRIIREVFFLTIKVLLFKLPIALPFGKAIGD